MTGFKIVLIYLLFITAAAANESADIFGKEMPLTQKEQAAVEKAKQWIDANNYPFRSGDTITYLYGSGQPVAVCAPLQICLVKLGKGEKVSPNGVHLGDSARWQVSPAIGAGQTNLIIKPVDVGLVTTLIVVTDRRSYSIKLVSRKTDLTPVIDFHHPNDIANQWVDYFDQIEAEQKQAIAAREHAKKQAVQQAQQQRLLIEKTKLEREKSALAVELAQEKLAAEKRRQWMLQQEQKRTADLEKQVVAARQRQQQAAAARQRQQQAAAVKQRQQQQQAQQTQQRTLPDTGLDLLALDFNYEISACRNCSWQPTRVYNNGQQTVIQMGRMQGAEAPALLVIGNDGEQLVNYRIKGNSYVVDQIFDAAILVAGVGKNQQRVMISRRGGV